MGLTWFNKTEGFTCFNFNLVIKTSLGFQISGLNMVLPTREELTVELHRSNSYIWGNLPLIQRIVLKLSEVGGYDRV